MAHKLQLQRDGGPTSRDSRRLRSGGSGRSSNGGSGRLGGYARGRVGRRHGAANGGRVAADERRAHVASIVREAVGPREAGIGHVAKGAVGIEHERTTGRPVEEDGAGVGAQVIGDYVARERSVLWSIFGLGNVIKYFKYSCYMSKSNNHEKQQDALQEKLFRKEIEYNGNCMHPGCPNKVNMRSHILQENGILNHIAPNGKFMEITEGRLFQPNNVELTGVNASQLFTFRGLCGDHDRDDFAEIERQSTDFTSYREQMLFSYRALLNDLSKGQVVERYHNVALNSDAIDANRRENIKIGSVKTILARKDLEYYKILMDSELWMGNKSQNFDFYRRVIPKVELATSVVIGIPLRPFYPKQGLPWGFTREQALALVPADVNYRPFVGIVFLTIIPRDNDLVIIIGYHKSVVDIKGILVGAISGLSDEKFMDLVSNIVISVGTWCISNNLYDDWKKKGVIEDILVARSQFMETAIRPFNDREERVRYNMFAIV